MANVSGELGAEERIRKLLSTVADQDNASPETRWAYRFAAQFAWVGQEIQRAQRDDVDPQAKKRVAELTEILLRCKHLIWGTELKELSNRQALVLGCIAHADVRESTVSSAGLETLLYGVTDMRYGVFSGVHRYDEIFKSPVEIEFAARAVLAFHGKLSEPGKSKWDIVNEFLERHDLGSRSTPPETRSPGYKHPLLKVWQRAKKSAQAHGGNPDSTVE